MTILRQIIKSVPDFPNSRKIPDFPDKFKKKIISEKSHPPDSIKGQIHPRKNYTKQNRKSTNTQHQQNLIKKKKRNSRII